MNLLLMLIPMFGYGIIDTLTAGTSKRVPAILFVLLQNFITMTLFGVVILFFTHTSLFSSAYSIYALAGGFFLSLGYIAFLRGLSCGKAGVITSVAHGYILVAAIIGMLFLGESHEIIRVSAILIVLIGLTALSINFTDIRSSSIFTKSSGVLYAVFAMFGWGIGFTFQKLAANSLPLFEAAILVEIGAFVVPVSMFMFTKHKLSEYSVIKKYDLGVIIFVASGFFIIQIAMITTYSKFDLGLVTTIAGSSSVITAVLSYFFYKQILSLQEVVGVIIAVLGLLLLGFFA